MIRKIIRLIAFYEGGLGYGEARDMPLPELIAINEDTKQLEIERKAQMDRLKHG